MITKIITINVTQRDIDKGTRWNSSWCPIALAAKRKFHNKSFVAWGNITVEKSRKIRKYKLPFRATDFYTAFDNGNQELKPFSFRISKIKS